MFGPPTVLVAFITAEFGWNRCSTFDNVQVLIFNEFGLKCLFTPKTDRQTDLLTDDATPSVTIGRI